MRAIRPGLSGDCRSAIRSRFRPPTSPASGGCSHVSQRRSTPPRSGVRSTLLKAREKRERLPGGAALAAWPFAVLRRAYRERQRGGRKRSPVAGDDGAASEEAPERRAVREAVDRLARDLGSPAIRSRPDRTLDRSDPNSPEERFTRSCAAPPSDQCRHGREAGRQRRFGARPARCPLSRPRRAYAALSVRTVLGPISALGSTGPVSSRPSPRRRSISARGIGFPNR